VAAGARAALDSVGLCVTGFDCVVAAGPAKEIHTFFQTTANNSTALMSTLGTQPGFAGRASVGPAARLPLPPAPVNQL
jgi:hypothetical protein